MKMNESSNEGKEVEKQRSIFFNCVFQFMPIIVL